MPEGDNTHRLIKKYPNRRLYDTQESHYIKLSDLYQMIKDQEHFKVVEVKTSKDITQTILIQILTELESNQTDVLTVDLLRRLLNFYRSPTHAQVGRYLEHCLKSYEAYQSKLKSPLNSMLPRDEQAHSLQDAAEKTLDDWLDTKQD